jgi:hypothetical protein
MMVRTVWISSQRLEKPNQTFYSRVLCLYLYFMAYLNWRIKTALG